MDQFSDLEKLRADVSMLGKKKSRPENDWLDGSSRDRSLANGFLELPNCQVSLCTLHWRSNIRVAYSVKDALPATNPHRPNRLEPRVRKRRPKTYPLMTKPRRQLMKDLESK